MHRCLGSLILTVALLTGCWALAEEPATLVVRGDVLNPVQWSAEELKAEFSKETQEVKFSLDKGKTQQVGTGVPLFSLIQAATLKTEKTQKHHDLTFLVYVEARDSYRVFFSLAELAPQGGNVQAWLLWDVDGKPLSGKEAPFRLVVTSDRGHDRNIYAVASINLVDGTKLANQLAKEE